MKSSPNAPFCRPLIWGLSALSIASCVHADETTITPEIRALCTYALDGDTKEPLVITRIVKAGELFTGHINDVTSGKFVVLGAWIPPSGKRALSNTQDKATTYGTVGVSIGTYSQTPSGENGLLRGTDADTFQFLEFTAAQTPKEGQAVFVLRNYGWIDNAVTDPAAAKPGKVVDAAGLTKATVHLSNFRGATLSAVGTIAAVGGRLILNNHGIIRSDKGMLLDLESVQSALVSIISNEGTLRSGGKEVVSGPANLTIWNSGTIESTAAKPSAAIKIKMADGEIDRPTPDRARLELTNSATGVIRGTKHGATGDRPSVITNAGLIAGLAGSGLNWDAPLGRKGKPAEGYCTVTVSNLKGGVISGLTQNAASGDGDGVDIDECGHILNAGTIAAVNSAASADGIAIGGGRIQNLPTGVITAQNAYNRGKTYAILVDDSDEGYAFEAMAIENAGRIEGNGANGVGIRFISDKHNTILNSGTIRGDGGTAIILGDGGDTITLQNGAQILGDIVGGKGTDDIVLDCGEGNTVRLANAIIGIEQIQIKSGTLALENGARLELPLRKGVVLGPVAGEGSLVFAGKVTLVPLEENGLRLDALKAGDTFHLITLGGGIAHAENVRIEGTLPEGLAWDTARMQQGVLALMRAQP